MSLQFYFYLDYENIISAGGAPNPSLENFNYMLLKRNINILAFNKPH